MPAAAWDTQFFRGPARVVFGPPVDLSGISPGPRKARNREATDWIMVAIAELVAAAGGPVQEAPLGPPDARDVRNPAGPLTWDEVGVPAPVG